MSKIDWKTMLNATLVTAGLCALIGVLLLITNYVPWLAVALCVVGLVWIIYGSMKKYEQDELEEPEEEVK